MFVTCRDTTSNIAIPSVSGVSCVATSQVSCAHLDTLIQGTISYNSSSLAPGSVVTYSCNSGFAVVAAGTGSSTSSTQATAMRQCQADGTWGAPIPAIAGAGALSLGSSNSGLQCTLSSASESFMQFFVCLINIALFAHVSECVCQ